MSLIGPILCVLGVLALCATFFLCSRTGVEWRRSFWDDVVPDPDSDDGPHTLKAVAAEIPPEEISRFAAADMVCLAVRETSYFGTRFFWVHEYETGRLYLQSLFIEFGLTPQNLLPIFGRSAASEHVHERDIGWDDLGGIPLKLGETGRYNEEPFQKLAGLIGKDISVELESVPLSKVKQRPMHLFVVRCAEVARVAS